MVILNLEQVTAYHLPRVVRKWSGYQRHPSRLSVSSTNWASLDELFDPVSIFQAIVLTSWFSFCTGQSLGVPRGLSVVSPERNNNAEVIHEEIIMDGERVPDFPVES